MNCSVSPLAEMRPPPGMGSRFDQARSMSNNLQALLFPSSSSSSSSSLSSLAASSSSPVPSPTLPDSSPSFLPEHAKQSGGRISRTHRSKACMLPLPDLARSQSPTTTLAADMSQNFHIARTPAQRTPRRTLFPSHSFKFIVTPSLPSVPSSPQEMDYSPLPHKPSASKLSDSYFASVSLEEQKTTTTTAALTTTTVSSASEMSSSRHSHDASASSAASLTSTSTSSSSTSFSEFPRARGRLKSLSNAALFLSSKPCLSWQQTSTSSSSSLPMFPLKENLYPVPSASPSSPNKLADLFGPSPVRSARDSFDTPVQNLSSGRRVHHSKFRRTQSMFQHPEEILSEELNAAEESVTSSPCAEAQCFLTSSECSIPTFTVKEDPFRRISRETLCEILDGCHGSGYDKYTVIDCRFEYEYEGGHIEGAININSKTKLETELFSNTMQTAPHQRQLLIFHCEYSALRGPRMAMHLRNRDRQMNMHRYPQLHYPDIVILQGGYSHFFEAYCDRCVPQRYVEMNDSLHRKTCEREMEKFRKTMKFSRPQTLLYTQHPILSSSSTQASFCQRDTFRFPLQEQDTNTTPTAPSFRKQRLLGSRLTQSFPADSSRLFR